MIALIFALAFVLRSISLDQSFWLDEAAQASIASQLPHFSFIGDFQPPLSYWLVHLWMFLGNHSEWFLRLPGVLIGALTVVLLYVIVRTVSGQRPALVAGVLLAVNPYHIYFSQELRMYGLLTLFVTLQWWALSRKRYLIYIIVSVLAVYTHYFTFVAIAAQCAYVLVRRRGEYRSYVLSVILVGIAFLPWVPTLLRQIETSRHLLTVWPGWAGVGGVGFFKFLPLTLAKFTVGIATPEPKMLYGAVVGVAALVLLVAAILILTRGAIKSNKVPLTAPDILIFWFALPLFLVWIAGIWVPANQPFRVLFTLPALCAVFAIAFAHTLSNRWGTLVLFILMSCSLVFSLRYLSNPSFHREDWRGAVAYTDEKAVKEGGLVLTESADPWVPIDWYSESREHYLGTSTSMSITEETIAAQLDDRIVSCLSLELGCTITLYTYLFELSDPEKLVERYLEEKGFALAEEKDFRGVGIVKTYTSR